jgi:uncharacterized SAM-dependent methyltransferase
MTTTYFGTNWKDREQESLASALAALRLFGVEIDAETLRDAAKRGAGRYSSLSILDACADLFRALNQPPNQA